MQNNEILQVYDHVMFAHMTGVIVAKKENRFVVEWRGRRGGSLIREGYKSGALKKLLLLPANVG